MRRAISLMIMVFASLALMIMISPSASAATGSQTCKATKVVKTSGARTVTTESKACGRDNGGYTRSTRNETCTRSRAGNACTSVRVTDSRSVSAKGNVTDTHSVTRCTKSAGKSSVCTTVTDTVSAS